MMSSRWLLQGFLLGSAIICIVAKPIPLPSFEKLKECYPGYKHSGGAIRNHKLIRKIGCAKDKLLHDTSALRLSYAFNRVGGVHSLGRNLIRLSKFGEDSVVGRDGLQYIYHPIAYGPFLADKYGYPSVSKLHQKDPNRTKKTFWGKQGILRVITYTKHSNLPVGHVALWDCNKFHQSKDWISMHTLITVEFWESPDSNCTGVTAVPSPPPSNHWNHQVNYQIDSSNHQILQSIQSSHNQSKLTHSVNQPIDKPSLTLGKSVKPSHLSTTLLLHNPSARRKFIKKYFVSNGHLRHAKHKGLILKEKKS